jgi:hypothetical protein
MMKRITLATPTYLNDFTVATFIISRTLDTILFKKHNKQRIIGTLNAKGIKGICEVEGEGEKKSFNLIHIP